MLRSGMPYFIFQKPSGTTAWKLVSRFDDHKQGCAARDSCAAEHVVVRMVKAATEGEARGKSGVVWNAITNDANDTGGEAKANR